MKISKKITKIFKLSLMIGLLFSLVSTPMGFSQVNAKTLPPDKSLPSEELSASPSNNQTLADSWSDNFDSYATGSSMHGQGGWKGWANSPAATANTTDAQAFSTPNSVNINGASDLVHEYSGYTADKWIYTAWQYIPSDFSGVSYFILLNQYDDAGTSLNWSTQVSFDSGTNLVSNDGGVSGGTLPLIKGQWVEIRVEIDLTQDIGSFYYNNQLLYEGTWSGQVSGGGIINIAAVDLFANGASPVYYDDISLVPKPVLIYLPVIMK